MTAADRVFPSPTGVRRGCAASSDHRDRGGTELQPITDRGHWHPPGGNRTGPWWCLYRHAGSRLNACLGDTRKHVLVPACGAGATANYPDARHLCIRRVVESSCITLTVLKRGVYAALNRTVGLMP